MTPIEKAENALNRSIEQIQARLREAQSETTQRFLLQSLVACVGVGEALTAYVRMIGQYARGRHGGLKQTQDAMTVRHAERLSGLTRHRIVPTAALAQNTTYTLNITSTDTTGAARTETFTIGTGTNSIFCGFVADRLHYDIGFLHYIAIGVPFYFYWARGSTSDAIPSSSQTGTFRGAAARTKACASSWVSTRRSSSRSASAPRTGSRMRPSNAAAAHAGARVMSVNCASV